ncbi:MAG: hypothetical protein DRH17_06590 [Deltaproteobacteria bacterium]|nr:MAG: hypothetical protein DRH17_06590 [Deltaproteobacteria bacterium]
MFDYWGALTSSLDPKALSTTDEFICYYHSLLSTDKKKADDLRETWKSEFTGDHPVPAKCKSFWEDIAQPSIDLDHLPFGSWFLKIRFRLLSPWFSKGLNDFYIIDNPILRDRVFKIPVCPASTWKGALRMACRLMTGAIDQKDGERIIDLFGKDKRSDNSFRAGRLRFFPSFFHETALEVINPHERERKVGINPILYEVIPPGTKGVLSLLYVPFDLISAPKKDITAQAWTDLRYMMQAIDKTLTVYGFSAKSSSAWGLARPVDIEVQTNFKQIRGAKVPEKPKPPGDLIMPDLSTLKKFKQLWNMDGSLKMLTNKELQSLERKKKNPNGILSKAQVAIYKKGREAQQKHTDELKRYEDMCRYYENKIKEYETKRKEEEKVKLSAAKNFNEVLLWINEQEAIQQ